MSGIPFLTIFSCADNVTNVDFLDIDFTSAGFDSPPIIVASTSKDVNVFASDITASTARLNFSATFTGRVTYIIRPAT
tara:strand:+ start:518 stop:751 length:234 start_codon:yes stop_codon:yes gene_type:complete